MDEKPDPAGKVVSDLSKDFVAMGSHRVHSWYAWAIVGIVAGMAGGLIYVSNLQGKFDAGKAAIDAAGNEMTGEPQYYEDPTALRFLYEGPTEINTNPILIVESQKDGRGTDLGVLSFAYSFNNGPYQELPVAYNVGRVATGRYTVIPTFFGGALVSDQLTPPAGEGAENTLPSISEAPPAGQYTIRVTRSGAQEETPGDAQAWNRLLVPQPQAFLRFFYSPAGFNNAGFGGLGQQPPTPYCGCKKIEIIDSGAIPSYFTDLFPEKLKALFSQFGLWTQYFDASQPLNGGNFVHAFQIKATLEDETTDPKLCSRGQLVKGTFKERNQFSPSGYSTKVPALDTQTGKVDDIDTSVITSSNGRYVPYSASGSEYTKDDYTGNSFEQTIQTNRDPKNPLNNLKQIITWFDAPGPYALSGSNMPLHDEFDFIAHVAGTAKWIPSANNQLHDVPGTGGRLRSQADLAHSGMRCACKFHVVIDVDENGVHTSRLTSTCDSATGGKLGKTYPQYFEADWLDYVKQSEPEPSR